MLRAVRRRDRRLGAVWDVCGASLLSGAVEGVSEDVRNDERGAVDVQMLDELKAFLDAAMLPVTVFVGLFPATPYACVALVERASINPSEPIFSGSRVTYPRVEVLSRAANYTLARTNIDLVVSRLTAIVNQVVGDTLYLSSDLATLPAWVGPADDDNGDVIAAELELARVESV